MKYITINANTLFKCDFKHILSYRLILYITINMNPINLTVKLNKDELYRKLNTNHKTLKSSIAELIYVGIIEPTKDYKDYYIINEEYFNIVIYRQNFNEVHDIPLRGINNRHND